MATTLASQGVAAQVGWDYENVLALGNTLQNNKFSFQPTQFAQGTGAGQADRLYANTLLIAGGGNTVITFTSMTDFFGNTVSFLRMKLLYIRLASGGASSISVGNATNPIVNWISSGTATVKIMSGGLLFLVAPVDAVGYPITAATADQLKILNNDGANAASVDICVMGCSA